MSALMTSSPHGFGAASPTTGVHMRKVKGSEAARKRRLLRLKRVEWNWQDRERGDYSTYRQGRPYARARRSQQQLKDTIAFVVCLGIVILCAGVAGGVTGL